MRCHQKGLTIFCIHSIFGNSSYAFLFGHVFVHFGRILPKNTSNIELFSPSTPTIWNGRLSQPCRATQAFYCDDITVVLCSLRGTLPVKSVAGKKEPCPSCEGQSCFTQWNDISSGTIKDPMGKCVFFLIPANRNHLSITINHDSKVLPNGSSPAGMCKNPGGRTSTTRTYHSLGAMLPSNWSIVDPM